MDFFRSAQPYKHWSLDIAAPSATLTLAVDPSGVALSKTADPDRDNYELKLNSYDIGVDIELADAIRRIRFGHPDVSCVVITGGLEGTFCAGANIKMLANADHAHKINFCKFTNETRLEIEDASANSGIKFLAAVNGACSGGGYELALACDHILLVDDRSTAVSLPEVPLLGVLPGTGGLTRLTDKRHVRRDLADVFATRPEGCRGAEALEWGLVDELAPPSRFQLAVAERAAALARAGQRQNPTRRTSSPVNLPELRAELSGAAEDRNLRLEYVTLAVVPSNRTAEILVRAPSLTSNRQELVQWLLQTALELDAVLCHLRFNEPELATIVLSTFGSNAAAVVACDQLLCNPTNLAEQEAALLWQRTLRRLDLTQRSILATVEPTSCCVGVLAELALAADRTYVLDGKFIDDRPADSVGMAAQRLAGAIEPFSKNAAETPGQAANPENDLREYVQMEMFPPQHPGSSHSPSAKGEAYIQLTQVNLGAMPMSNGISRLESRLWGNTNKLKAAEATAIVDEEPSSQTPQFPTAQELDAAAASELGLATFAPDDLDWDEELRIAVEERASFSGDALAGLEANHRFCGPETMASKIFARLSAWQNWIFSRPNASGPKGALQRYGTGARPEFDPKRA